MKKFLPLVLVIALLFVAGAFRYTYQFPVSCTIAPSKMNVFYIGVDNLVKIQVPGIDVKDVVATIDQGTISPGMGPGNYIVRLDTVSPTTIGARSTIMVSYQDSSGQMHPAGSSEFRIKRVPDPYAYVGMIKNFGTMTRMEAASIKTVRAVEVNFDFDVTFSVVSFDLTPIAQGQMLPTLKANSLSVTPDMQQVLAGVQPGDRLIFENIKVKGPDGIVRDISGVTIVIK